MTALIVVLLLLAGAIVLFLVGRRTWRQMNSARTRASAVVADLDQAWEPVRRHQQYPGGGVTIEAHSLDVRRTS